VELQVVLSQVFMGAIFGKDMQWVPELQQLPFFVMTNRTQTTTPMAPAPPMTPSDPLPTLRERACGPVSPLAMTLPLLARLLLILSRPTALSD
jgi:hypothetical protein